MPVLHSFKQEGGRVVGGMNTGHSDLEDLGESGAGRWTVWPEPQVGGWWGESDLCWCGRGL